SELESLKSSGAAAFRDVRQAKAVLELTFSKVLPTYRQHHADLLFHLSDYELFQPLFLVRVFEAVLLQGQPWDDERRIVTNAVRRLRGPLAERDAGNPAERRPLRPRAPAADPSLHPRCRRCLGTVP